MKKKRMLENRKGEKWARWAVYHWCDKTENMLCFGNTDQRVPRVIKGREGERTFWFL